MVLVTGTTGSGKSTTLAAMVDRINTIRSDHVITIEDPIEFLHRDKKSFINQREVEVDTANFSTALRAALRQDPDVILVGEMRDLGNDFHRAARGRNRPPGFLHLAHAGRHGNHPAHHRGISSARTEADSPAIGRHAARGDQPAPRAPRR